MSLQRTFRAPAAADLPPRRNRRRSRRHGMTLLEVILAMFVLGSACLAGLSGMLFTLRIADSNLLGYSAAATVRTISEQLQSVDYATLFTGQIPVDLPSGSSGMMTVDAWNALSDDLHRTPDNPHDDLQMRINPSITRVHEASGADYALVVIQYEWKESSFGAPRTRSGSFTMIVSQMSSY